MGALFQCPCDPPALSRPHWCFGDQQAQSHELGSHAMFVGESDSSLRALLAKERVGSEGQWRGAAERWGGGEEERGTERR